MPKCSNWKATALNLKIWTLKIINQAFFIFDCNLWLQWGLSWSFWKQISLLPDTDYCVHVIVRLVWLYLCGWHLHCSPQSYNNATKSRTVTFDDDVVQSQTHLSSGTRESAWVLCGAGRPIAHLWLPLCQTKRLLTVLSKVPECPPGLAIVLRALQHHGGGAWGAEHQDDVCEQELCLQVQLQHLLLHTLRGLPPGVREAERGVAHGRGRVRLAGDGCVALAALRCSAELPAAARGKSLFVEAIGFRWVGATHGLSGHHSAHSQVTHGWVAGVPRAAALHRWTFGLRLSWKEGVWSGNMFWFF